MSRVELREVAKSIADLELAALGDHCSLIQLEQLLAAALSLGSAGPPSDWMDAVVECFHRWKSNLGPRGFTHSDGVLFVRMLREIQESTPGGSAGPPWQPIASYPAGRPYVLCFSSAHGRVVGAHVTGDVWHLVGVGAVTSESERPTHWMPLPDPPGGSAGPPAQERHGHTALGELADEIGPSAQESQEEIGYRDLIADGGLPEARASAGAVAPLDLDPIKARARAATDGPWAWEWIAEKSNEWAVGQAFDANGHALAGRIEDHDDMVETIIERRLVGMNESGHASAADAEFIAHARTDIPALLAEIERLRRADGR